MKTIISALIFAFAITAGADEAKAPTKLAPKTIRDIEIHTEKIGDAVHWVPEKIEVIRGEKVRITANHKLEGGFDFHGLFIPQLKIAEKVQRNKPTVVVRTITLKPGEYDIGCQFHPKHVPAKLVVTEGKESR